MNNIPRIDENGSLVWTKEATMAEREIQIRRDAPIELTRGLTAEQLLAEQVPVDDATLRRLFGPTSVASEAAAFSAAHPFQYRILRMGRAAELGLTGFKPLSRQ